MQLKVATKYKHLKFDIARTQSELTQGLRGMERLPDDYGMLFVWDGSMVMDRVKVALSAAFINKNSIIVDIVDMQPEPYSYGPGKFYSSPEPYNYVLEVAQGWFDYYGWKKGHKLYIDDDGIYNPSAIQIHHDEEFSPTETLSLDIWEISDGKLKIRDDVKLEIQKRLLDMLHIRGYEYPEQWISRIYLYGDCLHKDFPSDSPIEVGVTINLDRLVRLERLNSNPVSNVNRILDDDVNGEFLFSTKHVLNYTLGKPLATYFTVVESIQSKDT